MQTANNNNNYLDDVNVVHQKVLHGFRYVSDQRQYDKIEDWRIPEDLDGHVTGDCDDFAIACRSLLREKGHNEPRLLLCLTETGVGHLICVLGKMALDNRQRSPIEIETLANRIGYKFISISGTNPGDPWRTILSSSSKTKKEEKIIIIKEEEDNKKNDDDIWNTLESM